MFANKEEDNLCVGVVLDDNKACSGTGETDLRSFFTAFTLSLEGIVAESNFNDFS